MSESSRHSVSVAAVVTDNRDRVLVVQRRDNGKWEIPGGILELAESIPAGLRREVQEETGLLIDSERLTGVYKNLRLGVVALVFRTRIAGGHARPTEESARVEWWTPDVVDAEMAEVFAIRVRDALIADAAPAIRVHDGVQLINETVPPPRPIEPVYDLNTGPEHLLTSWQLSQNSLRPGPAVRGWLRLTDGSLMELYDRNEAQPR